MASLGAEGAHPLHEPVNQRGQCRHARDPARATERAQQRHAAEAKERGNICGAAGGNRFVSPGGEILTAWEDDPPQGAEPRFPATQPPE